MVRLPAVHSVRQPKAARDVWWGLPLVAAAGYLIGWYFESKKIAEASQVNAEYEKQIKVTSKGKAEPLPKNDIVPAKFETKVNTALADSSGQREVQVTSSTDLVGYGDKVPEVQQKYLVMKKTIWSEERPRRLRQ